MFNYTGDYDFPDLTDLFEFGDIANADWLSMATYLWVAVFGNWFFAMVIGVIGAAIFIKYDNTMITSVYFIVMGLLFGAVLPFLFLTIIGIFAGFSVGILFYQVFISKNE